MSFEHPSFNSKKEISQTPNLKDLLPRGKSEIGFLAKGQTLEQVLERDAKALEILGYTSEEIVDLLNPIHEQAMAALKNRTQKFEYAAANGKKYNVEVRQWRGIQECPWDDEVDHQHSNGSIDIILNPVDGDGGRVPVPGLLPHLIKAHKFFEGGRYRVSPEEIVELLGEERNPDSFAKVKDLKF